VRGLAHIGIIKALDDAGIRPAVVAGSSAGSVIGAAAAAGMRWEQLRELACSVFWPRLLTRRGLEHFCSKHLPETFLDLSLPFAAIATELPAKQPITMIDGSLTSALSASCAMRGLRRSVVRNGDRLKDGGIACVLPARACRELGADFVISSDVWELSAILRKLGVRLADPRVHRVYPAHYRSAVDNTDLLIQPFVPAAGYIPSRSAVDRMIEAGEHATLRALTVLGSDENLAAPFASRRLS